MERVEKDEARELRIDDEAIVDCYDEIEQAMGWYCYLGDRLAFPFEAKCIAEQIISPLRVGEVVEVTEMSAADDCEHDMFVEIQWQDRSLAVPLSQLEGIAVDAGTEEAIGDFSDAPGCFSVSKNAYKA